jgi:glycosyltransferase involved in cell wall biosynthesis
VVGDGPEREKMKRDANKFEVENEVRFMGHVDYADLPTVYSTHDLFIYPGTWDEPFGRVFLESLASGTPIVATDVGATEDIIQDSGLVVENSTDSLIEGVCEVIKEDRLKEYHQKTQSQIDRFRSDKVVSQFEELYYKADRGTDT